MIETKRELQQLEFAAVSLEKTDSAFIYTLYKNGHKARCPHKYDEINEKLPALALNQQDVNKMEFPSCNSRCPMFKIKPVAEEKHPEKENAIITTATVGIFCGGQPVTHTVFLEAQIIAPESTLKKV